MKRWVAIIVCLMIVVMQVNVYAGTLNERLDAIEGVLGTDYADEKMSSRLSLLEEELGIDDAEGNIEERIAYLEEQVGLSEGESVFGNGLLAEESLTEVLSERSSESEIAYEEKQFAQILREGNTEDAVEMLSDITDTKLQALAEGLVMDFLSELEEKYGGGKIDDETVDIGINTAEMIYYHVSWVSDDVLEAYSTLRDEMDRIQTSRQRFNEAESAYDEEDYEEAALCFAEVIPEDTINYQTAVKMQKNAAAKFTEKASASVDEYIENKDFLSAREVIAALEIIDPAQHEALSAKIDAAEGEMIEKETLAKVEESLEENDFDGARDALKVSLLVNYNREAYQELFTRIDAEELAYVTSSLQAFLDEDDSESAIDLLGEYKGYISDENPGFSELASSVLKKYTETGIANADSTFAADGAEAAVTVVKEAGAKLASLFGNDDFAKEWIDTLGTREEDYRGSVPVRLCDIEYISINDYAQIGTSDEEIFTDVGNNTYDPENIICFDSYAPNTGVGAEDLEQVVSYHLGGEYNVLTAIVYRPYITLHSIDNWSTSAKVEIYGDGVRIYESGAITQNTYDAEEIKVNISGVKELKIVLTGRCEVPPRSGDMFHLFDMDTSKVCMANIFLNKDLK